MQRGAGVTREIELKFDVSRGARDALDRSGLLAGCAPEARDQAAVYYETEAGDLRRAGFSLRIRRSGDRYVQTAKHKPDSSAGMFERSEWESAVPGFELDFDALAGTPLAGLLTEKRRSKLVPLIRTEVHRTSWMIARGQTQVELTLDEGEIEAGRATVPVDELELELWRGPPSVLFAIADELANILPLRLGVLSKAERGFALARGKLGRAAKADLIRLDAQMSIAEAAAAVAYSCLRHFRLNESVLIERADAAALHQVRVAMRRLRSSFSLFRSVLADAKFETLRGEIRWLTDQLGEARNIDVLAQRLATAKHDKKRREPPASLTQAREEAYAAVMEALGSERFRRLMLALIRWLEIGNWRAQPDARKAVPEFAVRQLGRRWRKIKAAGALLRELDEESLDFLRIDVKKMRYSSEFLAGLFAGEAAEARQAEFIAALEDMQEELGTLNDDVTGRELIARLNLPEHQSKRLQRALKGEGKSRAGTIAAAEEAFGRLLRTAEYWR